MQSFVKLILTIRKLLTRKDSMFGNNNKYAVFGTARRGTALGFYFSKEGYISVTGAIEINRVTVEFSRKKGSRIYKTISKVKMFE